MRKILWLLAVVVNSVAFSQSLPWQWANDANSPGNEYGRDVVCDTSSGHVYVGGEFNGNLSGRFGASFSATYGSDDGFLAKYTDAGAFLWALKIGGSNEDEVRSVALDPSGNVYVSGIFKGTADFDPTATVFNLTSGGGLDGFLAKYTPAGALLWAVKYGGAADDESWKMYADGNGIFITGCYTNAPATFHSFSSPVTKSTSATAGGGSDMFGAKYDAGGVVQWVVSGGGNKEDCGYSVVADAGQVYFIGGYNATTNFMDAAGVSQTALQAQQNNREQVFIVAYDQSGNFAWQNNITCTANKTVIGYTIAQDATGLYVSGYMEDNTINFSYPSTSFTQTISSGGGPDIFLAKLSKTGSFTWRAAVTGSGSAEQIGRELEVNSDGDVVLSGNFRNSLDYSAAGGPVLTASALDIFVAAYSNAGIFKWAVKAGNTGDDVVNGSASGRNRSIYLTGDHSNGAVFGAYTLTPGGGDNIYLAKLGCIPPGNNVVTSTQTICAGNMPSALNGSLPTGTGPYTYVWQQSIDNTSWVNAGGTFTAQNYSPQALNSSIYYRRIVTVTGACSATLASASVLISVDQIPSAASAGTSQTLCASSATLSGNTPTTGTGLWFVATGTSTITNPASAGSAVTGLSIGSNNFVWTISNGVCPSSSSTVTVSRDASPTIANAGTSQTLCASSATLSGNMPTTGTGVWSVATGTATVTNPSSAGTAVNGLSVGSNNFVWTISNGVCPSSSSTVIVSRDASPTIANAGTSQTLCASSATLSGNMPTTGTGLWSVATGTATVTNPASAGSAVTGLSVGANRFVWTISNGVCPSSSSTVTVSRDANPTIANAGTSQTLCASSATLSGNTPTTGTGLWSVATGTSTVVNPSSAGTAINGLSVGPNNFVWTISNGVCLSSSSTVTVSRDASPTIANAGTSQTLCTSSATLSGNTPTTGTGLWSVATGTATVTNPASAGSAVTGLSVGSNNFVWTISNGVCPSSSSTVTVSRDASPTIANAGTSQTLCTSSATLSGNTPTTGTGLWSVATGTATVTNPASAGSAVTGLSVGPNNFVWTISNGVCTSSSSTVTVSRDASPTIANAGTSQTLCTSSATLSGNTPTTGTGLWSVVTGTATVTNPAFAGSAVSGLDAGINEFTWTISNGICPSSSATVTIVQDLPPTPSAAGSSQTLCASSTTMNANNPSNGSGAWSVVSGNASFSANNNPSAIASALPVGQTILAWTTSNGTCPVSSSTVALYHDATPTNANAGADQSLCAANATLTANTPATGTGAWLVAQGTATIALLNNSSTPVSLGTGQNVFVWSIVNGVCPVSRDTVIITRDDLPTPAHAGPDQRICSATSMLSANLPTTGTGVWTSLSGNGFGSAGQAQTLVNSLGTGINTLVWSVTNGSCPASRDTVIIRVDESPSDAYAGVDLRICSDAVTLAATQPSKGSGSWRLVSGSVSVSDTSASNAFLSALGSGTTSLLWITRNGVCPEKSDQLEIVRDLMPDTARAGDDQSTDYPVALLAANQPRTGTGFWTVTNGMAEIENPLAFKTQVKLAEGESTFRWTISNGSCPSSSDEVTVISRLFSIPNAFSPNGDGINDTFVIPGIDYYDGIMFQVFNRWGALVYSNANYKNDWSGLNSTNETIADDTYYYSLEMPTGKTMTGFIIVKRSK